MLKTTLTLAAVSLTLLLSTSVFAQNIQYLGAHTVEDLGDPFDWVSGGQGVLEFNRRCAAAFDGAQMCESIDVLRSGSLPDDAALTAGVMQWIKPTIVQVLVDPNDITVNRMFDASGVTANFPGGLSCLGWSTGSVNNHGLIMSGDGQFGSRSCDISADFVTIACCKVTSGKKK